MDTKQVLCIHANGQTRVNPDACKHERTEIQTRGIGTHLEAGEPVDSLVDILVCLDCGAVIDATGEVSHEL
jgi:hypothetical protein